MGGTAFKSPNDHPDVSNFNNIELNQILESPEKAKAPDLDTGKRAFPIKVVDEGLKKAVKAGSEKPYQSSPDSN